MAIFDISVLRDCIEGLAECRSRSDSQQSTDQLLALVDHSFSVLREYVEECVDEDPVLTHSVCILLSKLVSLWYETGSLNETTLKTWRLFPKVLERHALELDDRSALEFCRLLISYCSEGLDTLQISTYSLSGGIEQYLEQHNSTIKLIGFFTIRLLELLRFCSDQLRDHLPAALSLVLRYVSVLHLIGQHSNSVSSQTEKTFLYLRRALQSHTVNSTVTATLLNTANADTSSLDDVYQTHVGVICCAIEYVEQYSVQISNQSSERLPAEGDVVICPVDVVNWVDVFISAMQSVCIECAGHEEDAYWLALLQRMVGALATAMSLVTCETDLFSLIHACICTGRAKSSIATMLLTGVLTLFENEAQLSLVNAVWHVCHSSLHRCTYTAEASSVSLALRSMLLVVGCTARYELLCTILRFTDIFFPATGGSSIQHTHPQDFISVAVPQSVKERILSALPVTHLLSQNEEDPSQQLLSSMLAQSVASIEGYAGAPGAAAGTSTRDGSIEIGRALSILRASSGYMESAAVVSKAGQSGGWRQVREPIVRNISLGTAILRWVSSLSQHIKILVPPPDSAGAAPTSSNISSGALNVHRLSRVERLVDTLTALVQCLWGHAVPRAVQSILAKAAQCCVETALSILTNRVCADSEDMFVVHAVDKLLRCAATTLTVIANPSFSEKSVDAVKGVYAVWHRVCGLCMQHPRATINAYGWQELVRMLASLQRFANSLPVPLKPRARELVDSALVGVIQARALGRTFSFIQRCDVTDEAGANRHVSQALRIGVHELSMSGLLEDVVAAVPSRLLQSKEVGRRSCESDAIITTAAHQAKSYDRVGSIRSDENNVCDNNETGYEEINGTAGTEGEENEEMGREEKRDRAEDEQEDCEYLAKRQRSGTQGSNDDDGGFADEYIY